MQEQLVSLLHAACYQTIDTETSLNIDGALVIAESLAASVESSASLRKQVLYLLSLDALAAPLRRFLEQDRSTPPIRVDHDHCDMCPGRLARKQMNLRQTICTLFLKTALFAQRDELSLDPLTGLALLEESASLNCTLPACQRYTNTNHARIPPPVSVFESKSTPGSAADSGHWRSRIKSQLAQNADHQYHTVIRTMGEACEDLERRCNEVERPLRDEQAKSTQLGMALKKSELQTQQLESHIHEQSSIMEGLENEKSELVARVGELEHALKDRSHGEAELRQKFGEAEQRTEDAVRKCTNTVKELELLHSATLAEKDEALDTQHRKVLALKVQIQDLEADAANLRAEGNAVNDELSRLRTMLSDQQAALSEAQALASGKQDYLDRQQDIVDKLEANKKGMQVEVVCCRSVH